MVNALWRIGQLPAVYLVSKDLEKQTSVLWEQRTQDEEMRHRLRPVIGHFRGLPVVVVSTTSGCLIAVGANGRAEVRHLPVV